MFRLERIQQIGERFATCRDYLQGVARIHGCAMIPECGHDYSRPFFRHDRRLFADISRLIYNLLGEFYDEAAGRSLLIGMEGSEASDQAGENRTVTSRLRS